VRRVVLDASALLAAIHGEPGAADVEEHLDGAALSAVNLSEVVTALARRGVPPAKIVAALEPLHLDVHPFDATDAHACGDLARHAPALSLGDRACLSLAKRLRRPALTADRAWGRIDAGVEVVLVR
jgi:PIN domain nuclease of toxin-antitoxin system